MVVMKFHGDSIVTVDRLQACSMCLLLACTDYLAPAHTLTCQSAHVPFSQLIVAHTDPLAIQTAHLPHSHVVMRNSMANSTSMVLSSMTASGYLL